MTQSFRGRSICQSSLDTFSPLEAFRHNYLSYWLFDLECNRQNNVYGCKSLISLPWTGSSMWSRIDTSLYPLLNTTWYNFEMSVYKVSSKRDRKSTRLNSSHEW